MGKARIIQAPRIELDVYLKLSAPEARALYVLTMYGEQKFLDFFYEYLGTAYLKPHEAGLRSLFQTVAKDLPPILQRYTAAQQAFALAKPVVRNQKDL